MPKVGGEFTIEKDEQTGKYTWEIKVSGVGYDTEEKAVHEMSVVLGRLAITSDDIEDDEVKEE